MTEIVNAWQQYLRNMHDWQNLIKDVNPKETANGLIYELANPIDRPHESFAIADMRAITFSEPHYHPNVEIYFVLQGSGLLVIGGKEELIQQNCVIVIPSNVAHFIIAHQDLVLAIVNSPPFCIKDYFPLTHENKTVQFDKAQFNRLSGQQ